MVASIRSVRTSTISGGAGTAARGAVQPGDLLIAFHAADDGWAEDRTISGGWIRRPAEEGMEWAGVTVWTRVASANEPSGYQVTQGPTADGVVHIVAVRDADTDQVTIRSDFGTIAPRVRPATASGVEIRYVAVAPDEPNTVSWSAPSGYTLVQAQSGYWTSAAVATRTYSSSAWLPRVEFVPSGIIWDAIAYTIVVESAPSVPPPPPPSYPPIAPGRGTALYQYVFRRLLSGEYLGTLDLEGVTFDKRILQPGSFSATIPIPNKRIGDQVAEIIPRTAEELSIGPGVIVVDIWRAGEPWGEYWITAATPSRSRRGTPTIQLRGSTLDAYLAQVEIQDELVFSADQIEIARQLIGHMQSDPHANIGLVLQDGVSGVTRERTYTAEESGTYGQRLVELAQVDNGFEWTINVGVRDGALSREWVWGYPTLGDTTTDHVFIDARHGGDILEWSEEIDALRGATRWRARGGTPVADDEDAVDASVEAKPLISDVHEATAHLDAGWPRIDKTLNYSSVVVQQTLDDYAAYWAQTAAGALRVDSITVALGAEPSLTPNRLGDWCRIYLDNEWHEPHWRERRIIGVSITPTSRATGREEAQLILESVEVESGG